MESTYFLKQTCSVISYSFIIFLTALFTLARPYIFMALLSIFPAHFFYFCNTCLFVTFRTSSGVAGPNMYNFYYISEWLQSPSDTQLFSRDKTDVSRIFSYEISKFVTNWKGNGTKFIATNLRFIFKKIVIQGSSGSFFDLH